MKYTLKIKPYGENKYGNLMSDFDEDEWDLITDLFERLIRNFKQTFTDIDFKNIINHGRMLSIIFGKKNEYLTENELEEYIETLCGYNLENIIYFDEEEYYIRGEIIIDESNDLTPLEKFNMITRDIAPELINV